MFIPFVKVMSATQPLDELIIFGEDVLMGDALEKFSNLRSCDMDYRTS